MVFTSVLFLTLGILFLFKAYSYMFYRPSNFPPGPPRIPIFGSYLFLLLVNGEHLHKAVVWLTKIFKSKVIGFHAGPALGVVVNDYETVKAVLNNPDLDGRPDIYIARMRDPQHNLRGIFFTDGERWKEQRQFALRHLREYGFGRRSSELEIEVRDEICAFVEMLRTGPKYKHEFTVMRPNGEVMVPNIFFSTMSNAFLKVLSGDKFSREEQESLFETGSGAFLFQKSADDYGKLLSIVPWIRHFFPNLSSYNQIGQGHSIVYNFIKALVDKHMKTFDESHERNFIDSYIGEMKRTNKMGNTNSSFQYDQLVLTCTDFFFPALASVPVTISFLIQRFLLQPELTERMQKEIDDVVGSGRLPELDDRVKLPFTEACIREILRLETLVPSAIPHRAQCDTKIGSYDIPKDTLVWAGLAAYHNDADLWGDPASFRPDRFLDEDGQLSLKLDKTLPFGAGKRVCAGETFARNTLFVMVAGFFQNFNIALAKDEPFPALNRNKTGLIAYTPKFWVRATPR